MPPYSIQAENPCVIFPDGAIVDGEIKVEGVTLTYSEMIHIRMMGFEAYVLPSPVELPILLPIWTTQNPGVSVVSVIRVAGSV